MYRCKAVRDCYKRHENILHSATPHKQNILFLSTGDYCHNYLNIYICITCKTIIRFCAICVPLFLVAKTLLSLSVSNRTFLTPPKTTYVAPFFFPNN
ncbi:hypothetical protein FKM82_008551 [Ascaphus truei]